MLNFTKKRQIAILIIVVMASFIIGTKVNLEKETDSEERFEELNFEETSDEDESSESKNDESEDDYDKIEENAVVYIKGAVMNPGIVTVESGSRVADAIEAAGGIDEEADLDYVNLARKIQDEEMIHIPYKGEEISSIEKNDGSNTLELESSDNGVGIKININTASKQELETLSGIGDVTSDNIISYREKSKFKAIEDIMDVSGIGEKKFEAIKEEITVN